MPCTATSTHNRASAPLFVSAMQRPEFKQDVNELYSFFLKLLAEGEPYGIEWHIHNVDVAIDHLNKFIETHPKTLQQ